MTVKGGVTDAVMILPDVRQALGWLPRICEFLNLRLFVYDCSYVTGGTTFYPTSNDLKLLPRTLRHFHLRSDAAEEAFFVNLVSSDRDSSSSYQVGQLLNISSLWPELVTLDIVQYEENAVANLSSPPSFSIPLIKSLPATIENLIIRNDDSSDAELFKALSRNILHLKVERVAPSNNLLPSSFQFLPPRLETFVYPELSRHPNLSSSELSQWGDLPKSLTFLFISIADAHPEIIEQLPPNLTYLNLGRGIIPSCYSAVSSKLRNLQALVVNDQMPLEWTKEYTGTVHLRHISRLTDVSNHDIADFYAYDESLEHWLFVPHETRFQYGDLTLYN
jgi:hypothetical protein